MNKRHRDYVEFVFSRSKMITFDEGPRTTRKKLRTKSVKTRARDIDPYDHDTVESFMSDLSKRLNKQQEGLADILLDIEYLPDINPKHAPTTISTVKRLIQPYVSGRLFWVYELEKDVCIYCDNYVRSRTCSGCGARSVSYDIEPADSIYLNLRSGKTRQVRKFLNELQGNVSYTFDEWSRMKTKLSEYFADKLTFDTKDSLIKGILPGTNADMMKTALSHIDESTDDATIYYACVHYWRWKVFDFSRFIDVYKKYIDIIDSWCEAKGIRINKMFKYYWISLAIGFDISRHYFRISNDIVYSSMISIARDVSRSRSVPIPRSWSIQ